MFDPSTLPNPLSTPDIPEYTNNSFINNASDAITNNSLMENAKNWGKSMFEKYNEFAAKNPTLVFVLMAVAAVILFIIVFHIVLSIIKFIQRTRRRSPWILNGSKNAKKQMIIQQDPKKDNAVTLPRANNRLGGLEFSYSFWMHINDMSYRYGHWKHVMHKGNKKAWPLQCPGVWLHPRQNSLRIYCNTFKNIKEYVDIDNIPLNKWFCITICAKENKVDVFMNQNIIKQKKFSSLLRQNYGNLYINSFKGFGGFMSNIRYYDQYVPYATIRNNLNRGPAVDACVDSSDTPPYYDPTWWTNN